MQTGARKQIFNEINITPLTDIFLVLLIIMMVVAPMMQQLRQDIAPPPLSSNTKVDQNKMMVEITKDGSLYVQGNPVTPEQLTEALKQRVAEIAPDAAVSEEQAAAAESLERNLIIRADKATKSGQVLKIFEAARDAGFTKVTVAGEALSQERQSQLQQPGGNPAGPMGGLE